MGCPEILAGVMKTHRRDLLRAAVIAPAILRAQNRASDVVRIGIIGLGGISRAHLRELATLKSQARITAVCDIYAPRLDAGVTATGAKGYRDYRDLIADPNVDAVLVLTPDHWHARMAIDAMRAGKDVDVEKPMALTIEEAREMVKVARETGRVLAVDSEHTAHGIWPPAAHAVKSGVLGKLLWSQTSRSRNDREPPWAYPIEKGVSPDNLDWNAFLGSAPKRPFDAERFFRWRRYWEYSGGLITDLFIHHITPLLMVAGAEFPRRAVTSGGAWHFPLDGRLETPDTMVTAFDFPSKHTLLCAGSLANSVELPIVMRGHEANIFFHGPDHRRPDWFIVEPEGPYVSTFRDKVEKAGIEGRWLGSEGSAGGRFAELSPARQDAWMAGALGESQVRADFDAAVKKQASLEKDRAARTAWFGRIYDGRQKAGQARPRFRVDAPPAPSFMERFLEAVRTRGKPVFDGDLGYITQVAIVMAVRSWREDKVFLFDPETETIRAA